MTGEWGGEEEGAKSYDREKAWPSISHSILSDPGRQKGETFPVPK